MLSCKNNISPTFYLFTVSKILQINNASSIAFLFIWTNTDVFVCSRLTSQPGAALPNGHSSLCEYSVPKLFGIEILRMVLE